MKLKTVILCAAAVLLAACAPKEKAPADPFEAAVKASITKQTGEGSRISFTRFERIDSTTFRKELDYRRKLFDAKLDVDTQYYEKYKSGRMTVNADKKKAAIARDKEILAGLDKIADELGARLDEVAYYDVVFSGRADNGGSVTTFEDFHACVTADGTVMSFQNGARGLHKPMGHVIPGYLELVKGEEEAE